MSDDRSRYESPDSFARVYGVDSVSKRVRHLDVSHKMLNDKYRDALPASVRSELNQSQVDAFNLYLFSSDLQYIYHKYASCV